jgi:uncharacterized membrane protein
VFLVAFLIVSGYVIGYLFFPSWSNIEIATRITLAISICISLVILSAFFLALVLPSVEKAATIDLLLFGFILIVGFIRLLEHILKNRSGKYYLLPKKFFANRVWLQDSTWIYVFGFISILLLVLLTGKIEPRFEPRTDLALDFSSATPSVHITNHEKAAKTYQLIIHSDSTSADVSQQIHLDINQSIQVDLRPALYPLLSKGRLYLDLYLDGQEKPYRSLHFLREELPEASPIQTGLQ